MWFDAHLDLACLAVNGRDLTAPLDSCGGPWLPAGVTFGSLAEGGVTRCLATVFTEADGDPREASSYPMGDAAAAARAGRLQVETYRRWKAEGRGPRMDLLIECADPVSGPEELPWWRERGVVAIGLAWARGSRYATGNSAATRDPAVGLTDSGRAMVRAMDELKVVHDLSHLSDRACDELLDLARGPVIASHSNVRALLDGPLGPGGDNHRHLRDETIRQIADRGGVIGLNLIKHFIAPANKDDPGDRPSVARAIDHVEYIADLVGHRRAVGLGSDMDGGVSARDLPAGIDAPRGYALLAEELRRRGWPDADIRAFAWGNFARVFGA